MSIKPWLLKLHRWVALAFALPLAIVIATGLVLSIEPWLATAAIRAGSLDAATVERALARHDPDGRARSVAFRSYDRSLVISAGRGGGTVVDADSGEARPGLSTTANVLLSARRLHETFLLDLGWLVIASTAAMLALVVIGILIRLPRFTNTLAGWHTGTAWVVLPLVVLSPLTGLLLAGGITFAGGAGPAPGTSGGGAKPPTLIEAVRTVGAAHDLAGLVWIRRQGDRMLARVIEQGEYRVYAVTPDGVRALPRNWPRLWHEGTFAGAWSAAMNVVASIAMLGLLVTGPWIWLRRRLRRRAQRARAVGAPA